MNKAEISKFLGKKEMTITESLGIIDSNTWGVIYVLDDDSKLIGCATDGDIRRMLMKKGDLSITLSEVMNKNPKFIYETERTRAIEVMTQSVITSLPVLDEKKHMVDIILFNTKADKTLKKVNSLSKHSVVIMAGGEGTRLWPYTRILPKPLIPVGDVPIIERVINQFYAYGINDYYITVNYKKRMIESYFSDNIVNYDISFIEEDKPLGTAGSIGLIDKTFDKPVFVTNCDILIKADYEQMMDFHKRSGNVMTVVSSMKNITVPYGVLEIKEDGVIDKLSEKPKLSYLVNTGMYILNPEAIESIPKDRVFHMTDLIQLMIDKGKKVTVYPISEEAFLDMGEFDEMKRMEDKLMNRG